MASTLADPVLGPSPERVGMGSVYHSGVIPLLGVSGGVCYESPKWPKKGYIGPIGVYWDPALHGCISPYMGIYRSHPLDACIPYLIAY